MRYTFTIVRVEGPIGQELEAPPEIIDLRNPPVEGYTPSEWYNAWWPRPEDVPMPRAPGGPHLNHHKPELATKVFQLFYRVAIVPENKSLLDYLPPDALVRLRIGGKLTRVFEQCKAAEGLEVLRNMFTKLVSSSNPSSYRLDPSWELLWQSIMWIRLSDEFTITWSTWGDDDEDGGHSLCPEVEELTVSNIEINSPQNPESESALTYYTRAAELVGQYVGLFKDLKENADESHIS